MKLRKGGFGWNLPYYRDKWSPKSFFDGWLTHGSERRIPCVITPDTRVKILKSCKYKYLTLKYLP